MALAGHTSIKLQISLIVKFINIHVVSANRRDTVARRANEGPNGASLARRAALLERPLPLSLTLVYYVLNALGQVAIRGMTMGTKDH